MNYFELHVGDYDAATAHLSMLEDAAYGRMLRIYYRTERPLPADVSKVCRLVRAATKPERDAVQAVLEEFFTLEDDGWHQARTDEEIATFKAGEPEREAKKANEETRIKRHRDERAALFKVLTEAGKHAPWNTKIEELRRLVETLQGRPATAPVTPPATAPATLATATHGNVSPLPTTQTPEVNTPNSPQGGKPLVGLKAWLETVKAAGEKAVPEGDPVFAYADRVGIPREFLALAWKVFRSTYTGGRASKRYRDWRQTFRNAIESNWLKLWYVDAEGSYGLTTVGIQAKREHDDRDSGGQVSDKGEAAA